MILKKFGEFTSIYEEVKLICDYIIKDGGKVVKINNNIIKEVIIDIKNNGKISSFNQNKSDIKKGLVYLEFTVFNKGTLFHELYHAYEWFVNNGKELLTPLEIAIISAMDFYKNDINESKLIYMVYITSDSEINANYNQSLYTGENTMCVNYDFVAKFDFKECIKMIDMNKFISIIENLMTMNNDEVKNFEINSYNKEYIDTYISKIENIIVKQKNKYIRKSNILIS